MHIDYQRRMQGSLSATAQMTKDQQKNIVATDNGSLIIPVVIKDDSGQEPIVCKMEWAWVKKKRK